MATTEKRVDTLGEHFAEFVKRWRAERKESAEEFQKFRDAMRTRFDEIETRMQQQETAAIAAIDVLIDGHRDVATPNRGVR